MPERSLVVEDWGLVPYASALQQQVDLVTQVKSGATEDRLVFCSHHPVVTRGRASQPEDIQDWQGEVHEVSRGGRVTYHGPSQLVIYPIIHLDRDSGEFLHRRDVHSYLRCLEVFLLDTLKSYGLPAEAKTVAPLDDPKLKMTGIWIGSQKLASIGVSVRSWVTYHGVALNVDHEPQAFTGIKPCGFASETMTSLEEVLERKVDRLDLMQRLERYFRKYFV